MPLLLAPAPRPVGHLRFAEHRTREEIWRQLRAESSIQRSERPVQNLLEVYLALLRASQQDLRPERAGTVAEQGGLIVAVDGLQPEQGNEQLWTVRERGTLPFDFAGLRALDALGELGPTLDRCLAKKGMDG